MCSWRLKGTDVLVRSQSRLPDLMKWAGFWVLSHGLVSRVWRTDCLPWWGGSLIRNHFSLWQQERNHLETAVSKMPQGQESTHDLPSGLYWTSIRDAGGCKWVLTRIDTYFALQIHLTSNNSSFEEHREKLEQIPCYSADADIMLLFLVRLGLLLLLTCRMDKILRGQVSFLNPLSSGPSK